MNRVAMWCFVGWVVAQLGATAAQVPHWRSEPTLWAQAVEHAPLKPRPALNYARALMLEGRFSEAEPALYRTLALAEQPHVPAYDRADAIGAAQANLQTLSVMRAVAGLAAE